MAITVTNTNTSILLNILDANRAEQTSLLRQLSTGKRINSGRDDPAGLIALSGLNAEPRAVDSSLSNNQRTDAMLTVADKSFDEISKLLGEIQTLVQSTASNANLTAAEVAANQSQIDDALSAIDRIVTTTNFNGKKLIDGSLAVDVTGVSNTYIDSVNVYGRSQATTDTVLTVSRVASAQLATVSLATLGSASTTRTSGTTQLTIAGTLGTASITLTSGLTQAQVISTINAAKAQTGASAYGTASDIKLNSTTYGASAFVSVEVLSGGKVNSSYGTATTDGSTANDFASISKTFGVNPNITVNGQTAGTDGLDVTYSANGLNLTFTLSQAFGSGNTGGTTSTTFTAKATGGATFQLGTEASTRATIGINSLATYQLGGANGTKRLSELKSGGSASLTRDVASALTAVRAAITEVATSRGRLGGFQKFQVGSAINSLQAAQTGLTEAAGGIGDTDFAVATAALNRSQVLIQSGISLLGVVNQQTSQILSLLR
ncbi:MAG: hypothetical protein HY763_06375 [Planctomycetes bacterium]|nr:hypothetical protein [Planctomycetota bacterium]